MAAEEGSDVLKAAEGVWKMLDHLSLNNPEEYRRFVKNQLEEGKNAMAVPEPSFCLRCSLNLVSS